MGPVSICTKSDHTAIQCRSEQRKVVGSSNVTAYKIVRKEEEQKGVPLFSAVIANK